MVQQKYLKMLSHLIYLSVLLISAHASGEFTVLTSPPSAEFKGHDHLKASLLKEVYSACLGLSTEEDSNWQGLYLKDPFNLAKAIVTVAIDGVSDIGQTKGQHFPLRTDTEESEIYDDIVRRVDLWMPEDDKMLVRLDLSKGIDRVQDLEFFKGVKPEKAQKTIQGFLKLSVEEDREFLEELALMNAIIDKAASGEVSGDFPHIFWISLPGIHALTDLHGENSTAAKEARQLLTDAIDRLNNAFNKLYNGRVLVNVITSDTSHTRRVPREAKADPNTDDLNLAKSYSSDYPVIFNIILWFGITMVFSLLAVSLFISNLDPGRDSIIYRMTNTRMKKDN